MDDADGSGDDDGKLLPGGTPLRPPGESGTPFPRLSGEAGDVQVREDEWEEEEELTDV